MGLWVLKILSFSEVAFFLRHRNDQLIGVSAGSKIIVFVILQSSPLFRNVELTTVVQGRISPGAVLELLNITRLDHQRTFPNGSGIRNNADTRDDFPAPVRPTTPTFSLLETGTLISLKTRGPPLK